MSIIDHPESTSLPSIMLPLFSWQNPSLLSELIGDSVYPQEAFFQALRLMDKLGVPKESGNIGVAFIVEKTRPSELPSWFSRIEPAAARCLRASLLVESSGIPLDEDTLKMVKQFAENLAKQQWWGVEICSLSRCLDQSLVQIARFITQAGLHSMISLQPESLKKKNQDVIDEYEIVGVDLSKKLALNASQISRLNTKPVFAQVISATEIQCTDLEQALEKLVLLRASLSADSHFGIGISGQFPDRIISPEPLGFTTIGEQQFAQVEKIHELIDLSTALSHGKESVAFAFAANQIAQAARQTATSLK